MDATRSDDGGRKRMPLIRAGSIVTPRRGEILPQQPLDDDTLEGVPDDDRLGIEPADDPRVVRHDVLDAVSRDAVRLLARLLDRARVTGASPGATGEYPASRQRSPRGSRS